MKNTSILFARQMKHISRSPDTIMSAMVQPVLLMLLFVFVFGGAIKTSLPDGVNYVNFLFPGILVLSVGYNTAYTALRMFSDKDKGIWNRFNSMPVNRSSTLWAHVLTSIVSSLCALILVFAVGFAIGFRSGANMFEWLAVFGIIVTLALALTWVAVIPGLIAKTVHGALFSHFR